MGIWNVTSIIHIVHCHSVLKVNPNINHNLWSDLQMYECVGQGKNYMCFVNSAKKN